MNQTIPEYRKALINHLEEFIDSIVQDYDDESDDEFNIKYDENIETILDTEINYEITNTSEMEHETTTTTNYMSDETMDKSDQGYDQNDLYDIRNEKRFFKDIF